jgi:hypothetical protein
MIKQAMRMVRPQHVTLFAMLYASVHAFEWLLRQTTQFATVDMGFFRFALIVVATLVYATYRVWAFVPSLRPTYSAWLKASAWRYGKPLPLGPVHLIWIDIVVVAALGGLAMFNASSMDNPLAFAQGIGFAFAMVYLFWLAGSNWNNWLCTYLTLALIPLMVYPQPGLVNLTAVLAAIYAVQLWGLRRALATFPFDDPDLQPNQSERRLHDAISKGVLDYPITAVGPHTPIPSITATGAVVLAAILAWWIHVGGSLVLLIADNGYVTMDWSVLAGGIASQTANPWRTTWRIAVWAVALWRCVVYLNGFAPPLGVLGRLRYGRLIIPGYDQALVAPATMLVVAYFGPRILRAAGWPDLLLAATCAFAVLWIALGAGPSLVKWRLTGQHRMTRPATKSQQIQRQRGAASRKSVKLPFGLKIQ